METSLKRTADDLSDATGESAAAVAGGESKTDETVKRCLQAMSDVVMRKILAEAAERDAETRQTILAKAAEDPTSRKLFVRNLNEASTTAEMLAFYGQYGEVEEGTVCVDRATNVSKRFGFITFKTIEGAHAALDASPVVFAEREVHVNLSADKNTRNGPPGGAARGGAAAGGYVARAPAPVAAEPSQAYDSDDLKLFVRGLNYDTTEDTLREVFGRYVWRGG